MESTPRSAEIVPHAREVPWRVIAAAGAAWLAAASVVNAIGFRGAVGAALGELQVLTRGWVEPTLVGSVAVLVAFMSVVTVVGRLPPRAVGWVGRDAARAIIPVIGFWLLVQVILGVLAVAWGDGVELHPDWHDLGAGALLGGLIAQLLGNALAEETAFRGFFFAQFLLKARALRSGPAVGVAALASAVLFALTHLPNRILVEEMAAGELLADQAQLVIAGVAFAVVYVVSRNVFTTAGIHALANDPVPMFAATPGTVQATYLAVLATAVLGAGRARRRIPSGGEPKDTSKARPPAG